MKKIFVTGTDTEVGKTYVSVAILNYLKSENLQTLAFKPIASDSAPDETGNLRNADALALQAAATVDLPYTLVNPFTFAAPIAPHIAAKRQGLELKQTDLDNRFNSLTAAYPADVCLIEGAGGWHTPLNDHLLLSDWVVHQALPVVLVVGIRLGCLNHAILTVNAIEQTDLPFLGWIANCVEPDYPEIDSNIEHLRHYLDAPCLGILPYGGKVSGFGL